MKAVFALSVLAAAVSALSFKEDPFWKSYKSTFSKTYESDAEEARRYEVFNKNMNEAAKFNALGEDAKYGMTVVSDRFPEELYGDIEPEDLSGIEVAPAPTAEQVAALPASFDSRNHGWIPAIRSQGGCGSCWAFSAAATVSASYAKKHGGAPPVLSEQQMVDCETDCHGCNGGSFYNALNYAKRGLMLDADYGYTGVDGSCKYVASKVKAKVSTVTYTGGAIAAMKQAIQSNGIISARMNADKLKGYYGGIISEVGCSTSCNHAINIVGWGKSGSTEYWICRNSWNNWWGEYGYFRIVTGKNACGIESSPAKVTVL